FEIGVAFLLLGMMVYTMQGGIQSLNWTDALQTGLMLLALILAFGEIASQVWDWKDEIFFGNRSQIFFTNWKQPNHFLKEILSGALITIVMTGLDQDQMQKNLSCQNTWEAQKNMLSYGLAMLPVNFVFVALGVLLYAYCEQKGIALPPKNDQVFPMVATQQLPLWVGILFLGGLIAAAYNSADGALTALTTSVCVDFLGMNPDEQSPTEERKRKIVLWVVAWVIWFLVCSFRWLEPLQPKDFSVITLVLKMAVYTYGPLLGMFAFGMLFTRKLKPWAAPIVSIIAPLSCIGLQLYSSSILKGYVWGNELLLVNGLFVVIGLYCWSKPIVSKSE
ncbi:MAG: sodium:solute symporter, partial [Bacteroidia bacterium]|nr:sodium:solute symporter [Bacteroidia bacterium]